MEDFLSVSCPCPAFDCDNMRKIDWVHANCGERSEMNSDADMRCCKHHETNSCILEWRFSCEKHTNEFRHIDPLGLVFSLGMMRSMMKDTNQKAWADRLNKSMMSKIIQKKGGLFGAG